MKTPEPDQRQKIEKLNLSGRISKFVSNFSLGFRFVIFVILIVLLTGGIVGFVTVNLTRDSIREDALGYNLDQARLAAEFTANYITTVEAHIKVFTDRPDVHQAISAGDFEQLQPILANFVQVQTALESAAIFDATGIQRVNSVPDAVTVGQSFSDRDWFQEVMATGEPYQSAPIVIRLSAKPGIVYSVPVFNEEGRIHGLLNGVINIDNLSEAIVNTTYGHNTRASIIDFRNGGVIVAHPDPSRIMTAVSGQNEAVARLLSGESGAIETTSSTGELDLIGYVPVTGLPLGVMVITPSAEALSVVHTLSQNILYSIGFILISTAIIGGVLVLGVSRPLRRLVKATEEIGEGHLDYKIETGGQDEVGNLSRAISAMAGKLKQTLVSRDNLVKEIFEREKAESAIARAAEEWQTTFDSISDPVSIIDVNNTILRVNKAYSQAFNKDPKDLVGRKCFEIAHGTDKPGPDCPFISTRKSGEPATAELFDLGSDRYTEVSTYPILDKDGKVTAAVHIAKDITERKQAEIENEKLRNKAEMSSRLATVGEMAAGIAHEINNPLTGVIGFSELLLERNELPDDVKENLKIVHDGSQRVKEIVRRMLTFARQAKPEKTSVSITELVENTLELRRYVLKTSNIEVIRDYADELPWVTVDPGQMQQVLLNIIVNAEYAMKKSHDGGNLTIRTESTGASVRVYISDDGPGMAGEIKDKLFQPFFTTKAPGEGTGLGLALSHGIVQEHQGKLTVESTPGEGTTFIIELPIPVPEPETTSSPPISETSEALTAQASILVVDDESQIRKLTKSILTSEGHSVTEGDDPYKTLVRLQENTFDLILMDIRMPGMSGIQLFEDIKGRWPEQAKKVVFMTGDASDLATREFLRNHRITSLNKPFTKAELLNMVSTMLDPVPEN